MGYQVKAVKARILTKHGKLCGWSPNQEISCDEKSASFAYCGISKVGGGKTYWAQIGYAIMRAEDRIIVRPTYYCELMADGVYPDAWYSYIDSLQIGECPLPSEWHVYACSLDVTLGEWYYSVDSNRIINNFPNSYIWQDPGNRCTWAGEISALENDMLGTANDPVVFDSLRYMQQGYHAWKHVPYDTLNDYWGSDDPAEWGFFWDTIQVTNFVREIRIWDENPFTW